MAPPAESPGPGGPAGRAIPREERLIFALDLPNAAAARDLASRLGDAVRFYKVGLELVASGEGFALVDELLAKGRRVFLDLKLHDVPETVARAVRRLAERLAGSGAFVTVHAVDPVLAAACGEKGDLSVLAVTVLTSLDAADLRDQGYRPELTVEALVRQRARRALALGCDGVVASGREAAALRAELGRDFLIVTPGIRPAAGPGSERADQKRVTTPEAAFAAGADHIVVGRPIRDAADPRAAAEALQAAIARIFPG